MSNSEVRHVSELLRTVNNITGATRYFVKICDVMTRISKADYNERRDTAWGVNNLFNTTSKRVNRFYTGVTYYI